MHACGHDCHVAILMAVAEVAATRRKDLRGTIKLIFQPAEEGLPPGERGGAQVMVEQGVMENPKPNAVFGLHVTSAMPAGVLAYRPGVATSGADVFRIIVRGKQTHGARPWTGVDPVVIGSTIVTTLQTIISRETDVMRDPAVVTIGAFRGGVRNNIIPDRRNCRARCAPSANGIARGSSNASARSPRNRARDERLGGGALGRRVLPVGGQRRGAGRQDGAVARTHRRKDVPVGFSGQRQRGLLLLRSGRAGHVLQRRHRPARRQEPGVQSLAAILRG